MKHLMFQESMPILYTSKVSILDFIHNVKLLQLLISRLSLYRLGVSVCSQSILLVVIIHWSWFRYDNFKFHKL